MVKVVIVVKNINNFQLEGFIIIWLEDFVFEGWQIFVWIINGDFNWKFWYDYQ